MQHSENGHDYADGVSGGNVPSSACCKSITYLVAVDGDVGCEGESYNFQEGLQAKDGSDGSVQSTNDLQDT